MSIFIDYIDQNLYKVLDEKFDDKYGDLKPLIIDVLLRRKYAYPKDIKKSCVCEINTNRKYKHYLDKGNLLEGLRQWKKVIICDKCFQIFDYKNYNKWECPECGLGFNEQQAKEALEKNDEDVQKAINFLVGG